MSVYTRAAIADDVAWVVDQLRAFDRFSGTRRPLFPGEADARAFVVSLLDQPAFLFQMACRSTVLLEAVAEEKLGFLVAMLAPHPYNPALRTLTEMFWWVAPEDRGTRAGALLFQDFDRHAEREADVAVMTIEHGSPVNPESLTRRGYRLQEYAYIREVGCA